MSSREDIATALGVDPGRINQIEADWLRLMKQGVLVSLHVSRWRARAVLAYDDLGLKAPAPDERKAVERQISLGLKYLLPKSWIDRFSAIEQGARNALTNNSFATYWGAFVTAASFERLESDLQRFQANYYAARDELIENWDRVRFDLADEYRASARMSYRNMNIDADEDEFVERYVSRILDLVPPRREVESSFSFDWELAYIPLPSILNDDLLQAEKAYQEVLIERTKGETERQRIREASERESRIAAAIRDHAQEQKNRLVDGFMRDLVVQLNGMVYDACADVLQSIERNERLHPRSIVQLKNLIETIGQMNFFGQSDIDKMVARVRLEIDLPNEDRELKNVRQILSDISAVTRATLIGLGETTRSGRSAAPITPVSAESLRSARARLELDAPAPEVRPTPARRQQRKAI